jgi:hypothetical protein
MTEVQAVQSLVKPKRPRLSRRDHWRLFRRDVRLALEHLWAWIAG